MRIAPLSQSCISVTTPKNYGTAGKSLNTGANATKLLTRSDADRSLQRTYCLSSLSFLACLGVVYSIAAIFAGNPSKAASLIR